MVNRTEAERAPSGGATSPLEDREMAILHELAREGEALVGFQALRRQLDVHQQVLTRTLRRLEDSGYVARSDAGYQLTEHGFAMLSGRPGAAAHRESLTLADALLPPGIDGPLVAGHLAQRWFQGLRWYGQAGGPGETTLIWQTEDGDATVRVRVVGGQFTVEVETPGHPGRHAFLAARSLLAALAELYGMEPEEPGHGVTGLATGPGFAA